jgi:hypothetical protein
MNRMQRKKLSVAVKNAVNAGVVAGLAAPLAYAQQTPPAEPPQKIEADRGHRFAHSVGD